MRALQAGVGGWIVLRKIVVVAWVCVCVCDTVRSCFLHAHTFVPQLVHKTQNTRLLSAARTVENFLGEKMGPHDINGTLSFN